MSRVARLGLLLIAVTTTGCLYPSLKTVTETTDAAGGAVAIDSGVAGVGGSGDAGVPDAHVGQPDVPVGGLGGLVGTGGVFGAGGVFGTGGVAGTGGTIGSGGVSNAGGNGAAGGTVASGGKTGLGGATAPGGATGAGGTTGSGGTVGPSIGPCDIYAAAGFPCVAAHSTVRRLLSTYTGPLYQVRVGGSNAGTGGVTTDIAALSDGYANSAAQDAACGTAACTISIIYDQSGKGNDLKHTAAGGSAKASADLEADAKALPVTISGRKVYGEHNPTGVGYRNNAVVGTATGDNPETEYMVTSGGYMNNGCCFEYGNMETSSHDDGEGTAEAIYFGSCTFWGKGAGNGPWVMGDLENGLWAGNVAPYNGNTSVSYTYATAMVKGDAAGKNHWTIKAGNAQSGNLTTMFDGTRPSSGYNPMKKEGAIGLGTGGDNSNGGQGNFFEGVMTATYSSDAADDAVQANIVAAYGQ